ncbi:hypothetical protein WR25_23287 [Diploscapter pachys]|uniref:BPTI/Kunitz inhibitor domain-containing protein n=1 Tax=Diploscapter pachys TaxID=2018661 RepID=A0A2A2J7N3_9BILA|nr:hypothetical protein WR25_23287 [Diploscapter pachys]
MCFPFSYEGCDGNENNFETESLCYNGCRPADQFSCPANSESKGTCHRGPDADKQCPEGTTCTPGGMLDYCCNSTIAKEWEHEYNSKECENGGKIVEEKFWYGDDVLRGSHCDHNFAMLLKLFIFVSASYFVSSQDACRLPVERGHDRCAGVRPGIRYHFDQRLQMCFPFSFEGCGGNGNSFGDESSCYATCKPTDKFICPANSPITGRCNGGPSTDRQCPRGSKCFPGDRNTDYCCDHHVQKEWEAEFNSMICPNGGKIVEQKFWFGGDILREASCDHK